MQQRKVLSLKIFALSAMLATSVWMSGGTPGFSEVLPLLRSVSLDVSKYPEASQIASQTQNADSTLTLLSNTKPLLVHMEALRLAYESFGMDMAEKDKLMQALKDRYMTDAENAEKFFDYGYAQLVMELNKNGLFFLRKANDKLGNPFTSLAYGLAQIDTDRLIENAPPEELTTRKMDATYKLKDALVYNREDKFPGVWPSYVRILESLKEASAYDSFRSEDVTTIYVPDSFTTLVQHDDPHQYLVLAGDAAPIPTASTTQVASNTMAATLPTTTAMCEFSKTVTNTSPLAMSKTMDLNNDGSHEAILFYAQAPEGPYQVQVMDQQNHMIASFISYKAPYIMEDLEQDGQYELVIRQFSKDPYHPLYVYRWNGGCYSEDKTVTAYFN